MTRFSGRLALVGISMAAVWTAGCSHHHHDHHDEKTRKMTFEGPEKKTEIKVKTTDKHDHD